MPEPRTTANLSALLRDYGMAGVLVLLCAFFSVLTYSEQSPTGDAAAAELARNITKQSGKGARVLIAVRDQAEDATFAGKVEAELKSAGATVIATVKGEPKDARAALQIAASHRRLRSSAASVWKMISAITRGRSRVGRLTP